MISLLFRGRDTESACVFMGVIVSVHFARLCVIERVCGVRERERYCECVWFF